MVDFSCAADRVIQRWPTADARRWVLSFLAEAASTESVLSVIALGSAVRASVESEDIDLVVISEEGEKRRWKPPIEIDLRAYEVSDVDAELGTGGDLLTWAVRYGVPLFDRDGTWAQIVGTWGDRTQLPDPKVAERRAEVALRQLHDLEAAGDEAAANEVRVSYLTHLARAALSRAGVFPASRPELAAQLSRVGEAGLSRDLAEALKARKQFASQSVAV